MTTEALKQLEEAYRQTFDSDLSLLEVQVNKDGENGLFINPDGLVYDFATNYGTGEAICIVNDSLTAHFNDFALGYLTVNSYNTDSLGRLQNEAYGFLSGLSGVRADAGKVAGKCGRGWEMGSGGKCVRGKKGKGGFAAKAGEVAKKVGARALRGAAIGAGVGLAGAAIGSANLAAKERMANKGWDDLKNKSEDLKNKTGKTVDVKSRTVGGDLAKRK